MVSKRKILYAGGGALVILSVIIFMLPGTFTKKQAEPLKAIPIDAAFIIQVNNFGRIVRNFKKNIAWEELKKINNPGRIDIQANFIDSLIQGNKDIKSFFLSNPLYISVHASGKGLLSYLHIFRIPKGINEKEITQIIKNLIEDTGTIISRKYEGSEIYDIRFLNENNVKNFSYSLTNGLFIFSFSPLLIEDALRQLILPESLSDDSEFIRVLGTTGKNVDANVFINFRHLPKLLALNLKSEYRSRFRSNDDFASWAALDLNLQNDALLLNGFTFVNDSEKQLLKLLLNQSPGRTSIDNVLPASVSAFFAVNLSDENLYLSNFKKQLLDNGKLNEYNKNITLLKNKYKIDINDVLYSSIDKEIALAFETIDAEKVKTNNFVVIRIKSKSQAEKKFIDLIKKVTSADKTRYDDYIFNYEIDNELSFPIYKMPLADFLKKYLGGFFGYFECNYFTFYENHLIFGHSVESLTQFIHANILSRTLVTDLSYREFKNNLSPRSTGTFYSDLSKSLFNFSEFLLPEIIKSWEKNIQTFQKVQIFGFQLNPQKELIYTNLFLKGVSEYSDKPRTVWESLLDTAIDFKPQFVVNHNTKQTEIFLQDCKNNIYLINQVGRILWKQNIPEKINSSIFQIDFYANGKMQILFSSKNFLHLIDRNGNYVERYPVKLRSPSTNGMSLFDYDNDRNYRIFIAGEDRNVYAYDKEGSVIKGWEPEKTESEVTQPVNHFRLNDKDYIVFGDRLKTYILDRRGKTRLEMKELIPRSVNNNYYFESRNDLKNSFIAFTDTAGVIYKIYLDEKTEKIDLMNCSPNHYFEFKDINGDGNKDFIFLEHNQLTVFKQDKSKLFTYTTDVPIDMPPVYYHFSAKDRKIGIVSKKNCVIFLINNDGSVYKGFPLRGSTLFSIGYLGNTVSHFNLITGGDNNFLYNYAVQ